MIVLVLPAFNEAEALPTLLERVAAVRLPAPLAVLVVDDGSDDGTAEAARRLSDRLDVELAVHPRNLGLGAALRTGLERALRRCAPGDVIVTMDADDTHPPELLPRLLALLEGGADVAVASRYAPGGRVSGLGPWRRLMSRGAAWLASPVVRAPGVRDFTCGYRAYRQEVLAAARARYGDRLIEEPGFACMLELLVKLARGGARFAEAPLDLRYERKRGASKMRVWRTVRATLRVLASNL